MSELTPKQRKKMYGQRKRTNTTSSNSESNSKPLEIKESTDIILLEANGRLHQVPTWHSYNKLLSEHNKAKADMQRLLGEMRLLKAQIKTLNRNVNVIDEDLKNKVDKP